MRKEDETNSRPSSKDVASEDVEVEKALRRSAAKVNPDAGFVDRLSIRLRKARRRQRRPVTAPRRPRWFVWAGATAALLLIVTVGLQMLRSSGVPASPQDAGGITPGADDSVSPTAGATQPEAGLPSATPEPEATQPPFVAQLPPAIAQTVPTDGAEVNLKAGILIRFTQPMDRASVEQALEVSPPVTGTFTWQNDATVTFGPKALASGMRYQVAIDAGARSAAGLPLNQGRVFAFTTVGPLTVTHTSPSNGARSLRGDAPVTFAFNYPLVPINCTGQIAGSDDACPPLPLALEPDAGGQGMWINTSIYRFDPAPAWIAGTTYTVTLPSGVSSIDGATLDHVVTRTFNTAAPTVRKIEPANGSREAPLESAVRVEFNTPMDPSSAEGAFRLVDADGVDVAGRITWDETASTLVFSPTDHLAAATPYTVEVAPEAQSLSGSPLEQGHQTAFTTVPALSIQRIVGMSNRSRTRLEFYEGVRIELEGLLDPATLEENVQVSQGDREVDATAYWSRHDEDNYLYVHWDKEPGSRYCVSVTPGLADRYGNTLSERRTECFTVGDIPPTFIPILHYTTLTLDAAEAARLYFSAVNTGFVTLSLSELPEADFLSREPDRKRPPIRSWTIQPESAANLATVVPVDLNAGAPLDTGYYGLSWDAPDVARGWYRDYLRIAVVDRHVLLKMSPDEALVWVTDLQSGEPVAGSSVRVLSAEGGELGRAATDSDGIARFSIPEQEDRWGLYTAVAGEPGAPGFGVAQSHWNEDVSPWAFDIPYSASPTLDYRSYLQTDRPIYRPGQEIHARGILRADEGGTYQLPARGQEVTVELRAPDGDVVETSELTISEMGTFETTFRLEDDAALGSYTVLIEVEGTEGINNSLQVAVAAYRKPEFEVVVTPERTDVLTGERFRTLIEASYYAGGAVRDARVQWTLRARPTSFSPDVRGWWQWGTSGGWWEPWRDDEVIAQGDGITDSEGQLLIDLDAELLPLGDQIEAGTQRWELEATVTDQANFPATGRGPATIHPGRFYLGLRPESWVATEDAAAAVDLLALDWDAQPVPDQETKITLVRRSWSYTPSTRPFQPGTWTYEDTVVETLTTRTDADGTATFEVTPPSSGPYVVIAESTDSAGNAVRTETYLWVSGAEAAAWQTAENRVEPIADAESYRPGDVARILLPTPFEAPYEVLMTIEREGILAVERFTARESSPLIEVPILESHVPNVVVSFVAIKGVGRDQERPDIRVGMVHLEVEPVNRMLDISVEPDCASAGEATGPCTYAPGDTVTLAVRATDAGGEPVDAEVALAVVDKAVLALGEDHAPSLVKAFYEPRRLRVTTGDGLLALHNRVFADLEALRRRAQQMALEQMIGGIGGGGGGGAAFAPDVRQEFPDTALWEARLRTGPSGEVTVSFQAPDSLTTWVADARAVTAETEIGQTTAEFRVTRPLLVRPVTPRFFVAGDRAEVAAIVHNNTGTDLDVTVALDTNLETTEPSRKQLSMPAGGQTRVAWEVTVPANRIDAALLTFSAEGGGYRDAARPNVGREGDRALPVYRYETPDVVSTAGALTEAGSRVEVIIVPPEAGPDSTLSLRLDPTLAAGMIPGLDYLEHFPHACTEQLISRFLPNVVTYRALQALGVENRDLEQALQATVAEALEQLQERQNLDGGWGWWDRGAQSKLQVSAYATLALVQADVATAGAAVAGFDVNERTLNDALAFLKRRLEFAVENEAVALPHTLALYVLAEGGRELPAEAVEALFAERETLEVTGRAYLALALGITAPEDPRVTTLLESLRADATVTAGGAHWESIVREHWVTSTRATAIVLDALVRLAPDDPLVPQAVRWLMAARTKDRWKTTQETAWAILALTDAMVATGELDANYEWGVALNAEAWDTGAVTDENRQDAVEYVFDVEELLRAWPNGLEISRGGGSGTLYYTANLALYQPVEALAAESRGITIERRYCRAELDAEGDEDRELTPCTPITEASPGDLIEVRLTLTLPHTRYYLMVEDLYPAGMEPVDPMLKTERGGAAPGVTRQGQGWWRPRFDHQELRDERAAFYADNLSAGTYQVRYYLRAAVPGAYRVLPATASEMYFPEVWGRSDGQIFVIGGDE